MDKSDTSTFDLDVKKAPERRFYWEIGHPLFLDREITLLYRHDREMALLCRLDEEMAPLYRLDQEMAPLGRLDWNTAHSLCLDWQIAPLCDPDLKRVSLFYLESARNQNH